MLDPAAVRALHSVAAAGEYFTVEIAPIGRGWTPLRELVRSPTALNRRMALVRRTLSRPAACVPGDIPLRTAASMDLLGLAARLLSPTLAGCAVSGVALGLDLDTTWYRHGSPRLAVSAATVTHVDGAGAARASAEALQSGVVRSVLARLVAAYAEHFCVSSQVLWGNVASALHGTVLVLDASGLPTTTSANEIATQLWHSPALTGTVRTQTPRFVRNSCCLYYRVPGAGYCGDCVLSA